MPSDLVGGPHRLLPHPGVPAGAVDSLTVTARRPAPDRLELEFRLEADITTLRLPEPRPPVRSDGLWRHTCFEAFIGHDRNGDYWEFNFSPSGAWAAYHFTAYREGMAPLMKGAAPVIACDVAARSLVLAVTLDLAWLVKAVPGNDLTAGLSAVVEDKDRNLSYWALAHPSEKPDFHHADTRILALG